MSQIPTHPYGLDHPTWVGPTTFYYDSAAQARDAIVRIYGRNSGHVVVEMRRIPLDEIEETS